MSVSDAEVLTGELGQTLLDVFFQLGLLASRERRRSGDLKELELLTLAILQRKQTMTVGEIQRVLGILPAQMSRIIRSLESRSRPLIGCRINTSDKRKIDVTLTAAGQRLYQDLRAARSGQLTEVLDRLPEEEREDLLRQLDKLRQLLEDPLE